LQLYTFDIASAAYQLRWSLAIFPTGSIPEPAQWIKELSQACEPDGIRILEANRSNNDALMLLLSTQPQVKATTIVQRVKGRLQHMLRERGGIAWRRNFRLTAVGDANAARVDKYVADQLVHHPMASPMSQQNLAELGWEDRTVNIAIPINSSHGQYALGLHCVLVHAERWRNADRRFVEMTRNRILKTLADWNCNAARIALLADHVHFTMQLHYDASPSDVMLAIMNETCESQNGLRMWMDGFYVGTVGTYDMAAVRSS
jgi:REP element-mobilizing transposase RayT